jgi:hypothetical protein
VDDLETRVEKLKSARVKILVPPYAVALALQQNESHAIFHGAPERRMGGEMIS